MTLFVAYFDSAIAVQSPKARDLIVKSVHDFTEIADELRASFAAREAKARGFDIQYPGNP